MIVIPPPEGFYPSDPDELFQLLEELEGESQAEEDSENWLSELITPERDLKGLVVPHAGLVYSGVTATKAYRLAAKAKPEIILLIGQSHYLRFQRIHVLRNAKFITPIGDVEVHNESSNQVLNALGSFGLATEDGFILPRVNSGFHRSKGKRISEHAISVQIPFIIRYIPNALLVVLLLGDLSQEIIPQISERLALWLKDRRVLVITSSDLSHFYPQDEAHRMDQTTIDSILTGDPNEFHLIILTGRGEACGYAAIELLLWVVKNLWDFHIVKGFYSNESPIYRLLHYSDSACRDYTLINSVVGYASIGIWC
ncbi:MAG: AmmeMemoRadiSam system protein B [bacterium]